MDEDQREVTELLAAVNVGDERALDALFELVYGELRSLAHRQRRRWSGDETLNTTALVHEVYLRLSGGKQPQWKDRGHFFAVASKAMRQILIGWARRSRADKRGGARPQELPAEERLPSISAAASEELLSLDAALRRLEQEDSRKARVVECRFFAGLGVRETAEAVGASARTVDREWRAARAWLHRELTAGSPTA